MIIGMAVAATALFCIGAGLHISDRPVWEYKAININGYLGEGELNKLGSEGWELTGFCFIPQGQGDHSRYVFKRPVKL